jgi:carboxymethylenebutenolidase
LFISNMVALDTEAFLVHLDARGDVAGRKIGAIGFCMGGGMALAAAGTYPDRFEAVASYHGGNLATDAPISPHLFVPELKAEIYVAAAENDGSYPPDVAERFEKALAQAGVRHRTETYPAAHGWMMPDFPVYDPAAAERGWTEMLALFGRNLRPGK